MHKLIGVNFYLGWLSGTRMHDISLPTQVRATQTTREGAMVFSLAIFLQSEMLKVELECIASFHVFMHEVAKVP